MPDLSGPLFSLSASGTVGKAITYSRWRGIKYARQRVIPANPRSASQTYDRTYFRLVQVLFGNSPDIVASSYTYQARGNPVTARNVFTRTNLGLLQANDDSLGISLIGHVGAVTNATDLAVTDTGAHTIHLVATAPTYDANVYGAPFALAVAVAQFDHTAVPPFEVVEGGDAATPFAIDLVMPAAGNYDYSFSLQYRRLSDNLVFVAPPFNGRITVA